MNRTCSTECWMKTLAPTLCIYLFLTVGLGCEPSGTVDPPSEEEPQPIGVVVGTVILDASDDNSGVLVTLVPSVPSIETRTTETSAIGSFVFEQLPWGAYLMRAEKDGFTVHEQSIVLAPPPDATEFYIGLRRLIPDPPTFPDP